MSKGAKPMWKTWACGGRDLNPGSTALFAERGRPVGVAPLAILNQARLPPLWSTMWHVYKFERPHPSVLFTLRWVWVPLSAAGLVARLLGVVVVSLCRKSSCFCLFWE